MNTRNDITQIELERYVLKEYPKKRLERVGSRIDARAPGRLRDLLEDNEAFYNTHSLEVFEGEVRRRAARPRRRLFAGSSPLNRLSLALLSAALIVLVVVFSVPEGEPAIRTKGVAPGLVIYQSYGTEYRLVEDKDTIAPGDRIQIAYISGGFPYGAIVSVDGNQTVTRHLPLEGDDCVLLDDAGEILLPYAFEFDDAPEFERFYFIFSNNPFSVSEAVATLPPDDLRYRVLTLKKELPDE